MKTQAEIIKTGFSILSDLPKNRQEELICIVNFLRRQSQQEGKLSDDELELMEKYDDLVAQIKDLQ